MESLRKIAEDTLLLAANIRMGEDLAEARSDSYGAYHVDELAAAREFRIVELVVDIAERIIATTGIEPDTVWTPDDVRDLLDPEYGHKQSA